MAWGPVRTAAQSGATEDEIVKALALPRELLQDGETMRRLRDEIIKGHAQLNIRIRQARVRRAVGGGSVQLLMQMAPVAGAGDGEPDWEDLDARLIVLLEQLERARDVEAKDSKGP